MLEDPNLCLTDHHGPLDYTEALEQLNFQKPPGFKPEKIDVFSLCEKDYLAGLDWRPITLADYLRTGRKLLEALRADFPDIPINAQTYPLGSRVIVDFSDSYPPQISIDQY